MIFSNGIYFSANDFYRSLFGKKVYKVSVDAGCTCPNRDGTKGFGGCIFCSALGSGDFVQGKNEEVEVQLERGMAFVSRKIKEPAFIAYFQSFTNTYGNPRRLIDLYERAVNYPGVVGLAVGTRPDCLDDEILDYLDRLSEKFFVSVELGLQTINERSVEYINRCYHNEEYDRAVRILREKCPRVHVVTHLIFGLPNETERDMLSAVDHCVKAGTHGIKISLLHVLRGTRLFEDYERGLFKTMDMEEYFSVLGKALCLIPENIVVHRLTGDGPKKILAAPLWTADKKKVLNSMMEYFRKQGVFQGNNEYFSGKK
ncbi:MAG: TIGR01212 family radical SAM protein [Treponema sp.]|nr:TIGR01212 family radical SAM protein [Treponema sp.]